MPQEVQLSHEAGPGPGASASIAPGGAGVWSFIAGCVVVVGAALVAIKLGAPRCPPTLGELAGGYYDAAKTKIAQWGNKPTPPDGVSGVVFGDSVWAPKEKTREFAAALGPALEQAGLNAKLLNLTQAGFGAYQFYYLSSGVLAAGPPDFAVVEVNLFTCAPDWYGEPMGRFAPMAAGLSTAQVWRVHQALATQQVGLLTPLTYHLDDRLGVLVPLDRVRTFGADTLDAAGNWVNGVLGLAVPSDRDRGWATIQRHVQLTPATAELWYGRDFTVSPTAEVLRAFSDDLRAAGVTILYVVSPLQRRTLRQFGIRLDDLQARIEQLRVMLGASPQQWLETADLFDSREFIDGVHVHDDLIHRMAPPVVERLVPMMQARQRARAVTVDDSEAHTASAPAAH